MFLVVILVLSLVLAFQTPPMSLVSDPAAVVACVTGAALAPMLAMMWFARRTLRALEEHPEDPGLAQFEYGRGSMVVQILVGLGYASLLLFTEWAPLCERFPVVGAWPVAGALLATLPFLLALTLIWVAAYPADRAIRQVALETHLMRGRPVHPVWSLREYLTFNLRHQVLFILIPMMMIVAARDAVQLYGTALRRWSAYPFLPDLLVGASACLVAVIAPLILRYVWHVHPLPKGALRDQLESLCRQLRIRCSEILVWRSGGMIVNAAVMGVVAPLRYVLISDAMLEQLEDRKIEAVFGHEAGHVKRRHILFFLLFAFTSGCLVTVMSVYARALDQNVYQWLTLAAGGVLALKWGLLFPAISRRFERQADLFGARTLALTGMECREPCALHAGQSGATGDALRGPICRAAAHVFGQTLHDVAHLNGIPPEAPSMRHGSIASRSRALQFYAGDRGATERFERSIVWIKRGILAGALLSGAWAAWEMKLWRIVPWI